MHWQAAAAAAPAEEGSVEGGFTISSGCTDSCPNTGTSPEPNKHERTCTPPGHASLFSVGALATRDTPLVLMAKHGSGRLLSRHGTAGWPRQGSQQTAQAARLALTPE